MIVVPASFEEAAVFGSFGWVVLEGHPKAMVLKPMPDAFKKCLLVSSFQGTMVLSLSLKLSEPYW